jgi:hypothetical protein
MILRVCQLTSHWRGALAGMTTGGVAGVPISGLVITAIFRPKALMIAENPLSAPAIVGAAAPSSATTPEQRRAALLDSGKSTYRCRLGGWWLTLKPPFNSAK